MKLLSVALSAHDANFSYFDGSNVHYHKLERKKQFKRYSFNNPWQWVYELKDIWNIDIENMDAIAIEIGDNLYEKYSSCFDKETLDNFNDIHEGKIDNFKCSTSLQSLLNCKSDNLWRVSHYKCHALSYWMLMDKPDVSFVFDAGGDLIKSYSIYKGDKLVDKGNINQSSIGHEMQRLSLWCGVNCISTEYEKNNYFNDLDAAGKLMGLQSYGKVNEDYLQYIRKFGIKEIDKIFNIDLWKEYVKDDLLFRLRPLEIASTIHKRIGEVLVETFIQYANKNDKIFYSGGVAQNVIWNTELKKHFPNLVIAPHSCDEGLSLGGIEWLRRKYNLPEFNIKKFPYCQSDIDVETPDDELIKKAAELLSKGKIIGWYQGNGEIGPRALGNRSILMDPRIPNGKEIINKVKNRENYRPFGASVLKEYQNDYFDIDFDDDYMLYTSKVKVDNLPSITHVDGTCRIQTVTEKNPVFRKLLVEFYNLTGCGVILNTSMNIAGKPLAGYPENAKELLWLTSIDAVFIGNQGYIKNG